MEFDNAMRRQVMSLPDLLLEQYADLEPKTRKILSTPEIYSVQRIILTGCGDSYAAALATRYTFELLTGIPVDVVPAIELNAFYSEKQLGFAPHNPLVIAVSNSGGVARVAEAISKTVQNGAFALGITGNQESKLGKSSSRIMPLDVPKFESAPGTRSYMVAVLSLILLAIRMGEVRGRYTMDAAMAYRKSIPILANKLRETLPEIDSKMLTLAKKWRDMEAYDFIGSGMDYAAAWFGHAKVFEAIGKYSMHINTEEWLHMNFFMRNIDKIATVLVTSSDSPSINRTKEVLGYAREMKRPLLLVTDNAANFNLPEDSFVEVPQASYSFLNPLVQFAPICMLTGYIGEMLGEEDGRGCKGAWSFAQGASAIRNSEPL